MCFPDAAVASTAGIGEKTRETCHCRRSRGGGGRGAGGKGGEREEGRQMGEEKAGTSTLTSHQHEDQREIERE